MISTKTADQIAARLRQLQPPGAALSAPEGSTLYNLLLASADELVRVYQRVADLVNEAFPDTANEMLDEWEADYGLPAACYPAPTTTSDRQAAIAGKVAEVGGQSPGYYIGVAARLGIVITIEEPKPFYVGLNGCGDPVGEIDWAFTWIVHCPTGTSDQLSCIFGRIKPAHTEVFCVEA